MHSPIEQLVAALTAVGISHEVEEGSGTIFLPEHRVRLSVERGLSQDSTGQIPTLWDHQDTVSLRGAGAVRLIVGMLRRQVRLMRALKDEPEAGFLPASAPKPPPPQKALPRLGPDRPPGGMRPRLPGSK